jgi:hypothetical protein
MLTAADDVDAAFASVWMPYHGTPFFTRAMYGPQASPCVLAWRVRRSLSPPRDVFSALRGSFVSFSCVSRAEMYGVTSAVMQQYIA